MSAAIGSTKPILLSLREESLSVDPSFPICLGEPPLLVKSGHSAGGAFERTSKFGAPSGFRAENEPPLCLKSGVSPIRKMNFPTHKKGVNRGESMGKVGRCKEKADKFWALTKSSRRLSITCAMIACAITWPLIAHESVESFLAAFRCRLGNRHPRSSVARVNGNRQILPYLAIEERCSLLPPLAKQIMDCPKEVLVRWGGVNSGSIDVLVARVALDHPDVAGCAIGVGQRGVPQAMKVEAAIEARALLPDLKEMPELAAGEAPAIAADKERSAWGQALAATLLPGEIFPQLVKGAVGKEDLLGRGIEARSFEHPQRDPAPDFLAVGRDVVNVESKELGFAQAGSQRQTDEDVIAKSVAMLARDLEELELLHLGQGAWRFAGSFGVAHRQPRLKITLWPPWKAKWPKSTQLKENPEAESPRANAYVFCRIDSNLTSLPPSMRWLPQVTHAT